MTVRLTTRNFRDIAKTARDFEDYLTAVRGHDSDIAKHMSLRHDEPVEDEQQQQRGATPRAKKDYGRQKQKKQSNLSPHMGGGGSLSSPRTRQRQRAGVETARSPSVSSRGRGRGQSSKEENSDIDELEGEDDIFEEFSDDD